MIKRVLKKRRVNVAWLALVALFVLAVTATVTNADLVAYWPLDEGTGDVAHDVVGGFDGQFHDNPGHPGGNPGNPTWISPGQVGTGALDFYRGNYVNSGAGVTTAPDITVAFWMKTHRNYFQRPLAVSTGDYSADPGWMVMLRRDEPPRGVWFRIHGDNGASNWDDGDLHINEPVYADDTWVHMTFTFDSVTREIKGYIDGELRGTAHAAGCRSVANTVDDLRFGNTGTGENYMGALDEIAIWNNALTPGEVLDVYLSGPKNTQPGNDVVVTDEETGTTITFGSVVAGGLTTVTSTQDGPPPPTGFELLDTYYDIETTATFSGMIQIAIPYDESGLTLGEELALRLRHYDEMLEEWIDITTLVDTEENIVYGETDHLSFFAITRGMEIEIDIKPGSYPNAVNLGSHGVIPVAILSTADFDATSVDPATIELAGSGVAVRGKGNKFMSYEEDVDSDGLLDLVCQIETENLQEGSFQDGYAELTGETFAGVPILGWDEITIVPKE